MRHVSSQSIYYLFTISCSLFEAKLGSLGLENVNHLTITISIIPRHVYRRHEAPLLGPGYICVEAGGVKTQQMWAAAVS